MRFGPHLLDEIRARLPVSAVVGRKVALKKKGREWAGLSPFKTEKTPSFFVNDQKGFYHCFASGEHGDIFTFLMKTEGLAFPEAVERLAAEAGVSLPKETFERPEQTDARDRLYRLLDASAIFFRTCLARSGGAEARQYLERRGLKPETIAEFGLGYAPNSRSALQDHLTAQGFGVGDMIASGMLIGGDDIPQPYDRFRHRVMFPITDGKGRVVAFGGRALDPQAPAKYLNSPETPLFHKGSLLFNAARARPIAYERDRVIVVEGYMDVIALAQAGFGDAVAPLGTALTADQVQLLWRMTPEPTLCFDGDSAGQKAAWRAVDVLLPGLKPGYSAKFAFLPSGLDPDDMIRQRGAEPMAEELRGARALFDVLWDRELARQPVETPEQRAAFDQRLRAAITTIADPTVRGHYERQAREALYTWSRSAARAATQPTHRMYAAPISRYGDPSGDWKSRDRQRLSPDRRQRWQPDFPRHAGPRSSPSRELTSRLSAPPAREAIILKTLINHPWLLDEYCEDVADLVFVSPPLAQLKNAILSVHAMQNSLDTPLLRSQLNALGTSGIVDLVEQTITHASDRFAEPGTPTPEVTAGWLQALNLQRCTNAVAMSAELAEQAIDRDGSEDALARILDTQHQTLRASFAEASDDTGPRRD